MKVHVTMTSGAATDIKATDHAAPHHKKKGAAAVPKKAA
jgi:hypothetical protein